MSNTELESLTLDMFGGQYSILELIKRACNDKQYDVLKYILTTYIPTEEIDDDGNTILHFVISNYKEMGGQLFLTALLSKQEIKKIINKKNNDGGVTPVILACSLKMHDVVTLLVDAGSDLSINTDVGAHIETTESQTTVQPPSNPQLSQPTVRTQLAQPTVRTQEPQTSQSSIMSFISGLASAISGKPTSEPLSSLADMQTTVQQPTVSARSIDLTVPQIPDGGAYELSTDAYINDVIDGTLSNSKKDKVVPETYGGGSRTVTYGQRYMNNISDYSGGARKKPSVSLERVTDDIHERVIETIKSIMGVDDDTAKVYKSALYYGVKNEHPNLSGYERALEMEKMATKPNLKNIDVEEEKRKYEKRKSEREAISSSDSEKTEKPDRKRKGKKTSKDSEEKSDEKSETKKVTKKKPSKKDDGLTSLEGFTSEN